MAEQAIDADKLFQMLGIATYQKGMLEIENAQLRQNLGQKMTDGKKTNAK